MSSGVNLNGQVATTIQMSTAINVSELLAAGTYAVWAEPENAYITTGTPPSTALTVATGYPVISGHRPDQIAVPEQGQIACVSSSSGLFAYIKISCIVFMLLVPLRAAEAIMYTGGRVCKNQHQHNCVPPRPVLPKCCIVKG